MIVTLRPLTAANRILPEQALGRGLRRMTPPGSGFDERVVVIEHEAFRNLWSAELDGGHVRYEIEHYEAKHGYAVDDAEVYDPHAAERHYAALAKLYGKTLNG